MFINFFDCKAKLRKDKEGKFVAEIITFLTIADAQSIEEYKTFLDLIDFYLKELNDV